MSFTKDRFLETQDCHAYQLLLGFLSTPLLLLVGAGALITI